MVDIAMSAAGAYSAERHRYSHICRQTRAPCAAGWWVDGDAVGGRTTSVARVSNLKNREHGVGDSSLFGGVVWLACSLQMLDPSFRPVSAPSVARDDRRSNALRWQQAA